MRPGKIESASLPRYKPQNRKSTTGPCVSKPVRTWLKIKCPDTFYLVRANGTVGALTLHFPPQTSERWTDGGKGAAEKGWHRWKTPSPIRSWDLARSKIRCGLYFEAFTPPRLFLARRYLPAFKLDYVAKDFHVALLFLSFVHPKII